MKAYDTKKAFDVLELIRKNPERYVSDKSIVALQDFINGYLMGNPYPDDKPAFWNFAHYLSGVTNVELTGGNQNSISRVLLTESNGDEHKAFLRFFEHLDAYKKQR